MVINATPPLTYAFSVTAASPFSAFTPVAAVPVWPTVPSVPTQPRHHRHGRNILVVVTGVGALLSRAYNYLLLGGTLTRHYGWALGLAMGVALDTWVKHMDHHKLDKDPASQMNFTKIALVLGSVTVLKNMWLRFYKQHHPGHWVSKSMIFQDMLTSASRRRRLLSEFGGGLSSAVLNLFKPGTKPFTQSVRSAYRQFLGLEANLIDPSTLRKRLTIKSLAKSNRTLLNGLTEKLPLSSRFPKLRRSMYPVLMWLLDTIRSAPITDRLYAKTMLYGYNQSFLWRLSRMLPGVGLDMLQAAVLFYGLHGLLHGVPLYLLDKTHQPKPTTDTIFSN
jgi:hypothetical protein